MSNNWNNGTDKAPYVWMAVFFVVVLVCCLLGRSIYLKSTTVYSKEVAVVAGKSWASSYQVERYKSVFYRNRSTLPSGAYNVNSRTVPRVSTIMVGKQMQTHTTYSTSYDYHINEWVYDHDLIATGVNNKFYWPSTKGMKLWTGGGTPMPDCGYERICGNKTTFTLLLSNEEHPRIDHVLGHKEWDSFYQGGDVIIKRNGYGTILSVEKSDRLE